jgi:glycosyltransferase A (GT-A) superfamily protein (DUF2064 family)
MTVHALVVDPPRPGLALPELASRVPGLGNDGAATLAGAMVQDAAVAAADSGGDLLVNHPTASQLPEASRTGADPASELRELLNEALDSLDDVRFEPQVGGSFEARVGNTVTHLLRAEDAASVAVLDGRAPTLDHPALDSAAMKLRRSEVVVGPAPGGRVAYLGLTGPIDFAGAWQPPALETLVDRAVDAGHAVDFLPMHPAVDGSEGLASVVPVVAARRAAGRRVPEHTAAAIDELALRVVEGEANGPLAVDSTDRA